MKRLAFIPVLAARSFGQETVSFDLTEAYDPWADFFGLLIVSLVLWAIFTALARLFKGRDEVETPRLLVPKD